jgi:hypothetical protein
MPSPSGWIAVPKRLPEGFTRQRPEGAYTQVAACPAWTSPDGWLRLIINGRILSTTTVLRSADEMRTMVEAWRTVMLNNGWS